MNIWNRDSQVLVSLVLLGAAFGVLHVSVCLHAMRAPALPAALRWLAWLPPLTPVAGFRCGARVLSLLWCIVVCAYLVLRTQT
jgi:hypothetical protein